jgi:hypothetical protein
VQVSGGGSGRASARESQRLVAALVRFHLDKLLAFWVFFKIKFNAIFLFFGGAIELRGSLLVSRYSQFLTALFNHKFIQKSTQKF